MEEYNYSDLSKRRRQNFDRVEWLLNQVMFDGDVKPGYSQNADVWKDGEGTLYIDKAFLNAPKQEFIIESIPHIIEVAAQDGDTRQGLSHGLSFRRNFWDLMQGIGKYQRRLLNGDVP